MADGIKITYSRLKRLDSEFFEMTTAPIKTNEQQTAPSRVKDTGVSKVQAQGSETNATPSKRKEISPLQPEVQKKRKIKTRMKRNYLEPIDSEMNTVSQEQVQETKDPKWQMVDEEDKKEENKRTVPRRRCKLNSGADVCASVPLLSSQHKVRRMLMALARSKKTPPSRKWALQCPECAIRYRAMFFLS